MYQPISSTVLQDGQLQFFGTENSNVCGDQFRAASLTGDLRDILTRHFASETTIVAPELKKLIWKNNPTTGLLIDSVFRWNPQQTGQRPAILLRRRQAVPQRIGIGGERQQLPAADVEGNPHYQTLWTGSHVAFCVAAEPGQTEALATEVMHELQHFGQLLLTDGGLLRFSCVEYGEMAHLDEWRDYFVVPLTFGYAFHDSWKIRAQAPRLRSVAVAVPPNS